MVKKDTSTKINPGDPKLSVLKPNSPFQNDTKRSLPVVLNRKKGGNVAIIRIYINSEQTRRSETYKLLVY